jgi:hypothetical protein
MADRDNDEITNGEGSGGGLPRRRHQHLIHEDSPMIRSTSQPSRSAPVPGAAYVPLPPALAALPRGQGGAPLPGGLRRRLEGLFGVDLSGVQIHHRPEVHAAGALALTRGLDIYFAPGRYDPETPHGLELLGHELTHVVQQCTGKVGTPPGDAGAIVLDAALEAEANRMGRLAARALGRQSPTPAFVRPPAGPRLRPPARDRLQPAAAITYYGLGPCRQLNEIVIVGSHDAGITRGAWNAMTQDLDILGQAEAGARFFDLRVAAASASLLGNRAVLKAFHADGILKVSWKTKKLMNLEPENPYNQGQFAERRIKQSRLLAGAFGLDLSQILLQASAFVYHNPTEFLILKFDKCTNWPLIAEACMTILGKNYVTMKPDPNNCPLYKKTGSLNTMTLQELRGKVIVLFSEKGLITLSPDQRGPDSGIHGWRNLKGTEFLATAYDSQYDGMQYYGKGGTPVMMPLASLKINWQRKKQVKLMREAVPCGAQVMKMAYWTTTGVFNSIRRRNNQMWSQKNVEKLRRIWYECLDDAFKELTSAGITDLASAVAVPIIKTHLPNIVMIDFVDQAKCRTIYDLNTIGGPAALYNAALAAQAEVEADPGVGQPELGTGEGTSGTRNPQGGGG